MQLSKFSYYSDFFIYPIVCVGWSAASLRGVGWAGAAEWFCALVTGVVLWTLLEYVLHRIALHRMAYFSPMHGAHHSSPLALIGTPTWLSVLVFTVPFSFPRGRGSDQRRERSRHRRHVGLLVVRHRAPRDSSSR